jgi:hypothetical protein
MRTWNPTKLITFPKQDVKAAYDLAAWNQVDAEIRHAAI